MATNEVALSPPNGAQEPVVQMNPPPGQNPSPPLVDAVNSTATSVDPVNGVLLEEIRAFRKDSEARYKFNNAWDVSLTVLGILLSIAVVAAGFSKQPEISAILGAIVGAVVTAQKAFPFGQRASFYRLLIGQSSNLITRASQRAIGKTEALNALASLRMDFAQQLPRGSSSQQAGTGAPKQDTSQADGGQGHEPQTDATGSPNQQRQTE